MKCIKEKNIFLMGHFQHYRLPCNIIILKFPASLIALIAVIVLVYRNEILFGGRKIIKTSVVKYIGISVLILVVGIGSLGLFNAKRVLQKKVSDNKSVVSTVGSSYKVTIHRLFCLTLLRLTPYGSSADIDYVFTYI